MDIADYKSIELEKEIKTIELDDYNTLSHFYNLRRPGAADSNLLNLYLWKECYPTWYYISDKGIMWIAKEEDGSYYSAIPCCKNEDLKECFEDIKEFFNKVLEKKLVMYVVDKEAVELLDLSEDEFEVFHERKYDDYIYDAEQLRSLSGRKNHKKKNHLNAFKREYDGRYEFKILDCSDAEQISAFLNEWVKDKENAEDREFIHYEVEGVKYILEHCDVLDFKAAGVFIDGKLEAFTMGNYYEAEDMLYIPVEKANTKFRGLYAYINNQFLVEAFPNVGRVNREDDMGIEGLRQAKMAYNPMSFIEKYTIIQK